ncbi:MAG: SCP2 sterol-binding domain-containing protein [Actinomycetota bacterium]|nr:SCP2 sterol-binding domain-containing protein [Actinomycetota bacterium]
MVAYGTQEWLNTYRDRINASASYRAAAATWEGAVAYVFEAEPAKQWPETTYAVMDLWHGQCRDARLTSAAEAEQAPFVIRAPYSRWKQVIRRELDPIKAMMQGKLRLRGDLPTVVRHVEASNVLVAIAGEIPTEFPDEQ